MKEKKPRKEHFRGALKNFVEQEKRMEWGKLSHVQRSREMTEFYVTKVLRVLQPALVPDDDEEIARSIVDGSGDEGVDFLYRGDNRVLIVQTKFHSKNTPEKAQAFEHACGIILRLSNPQSNNLAKNQLLREALLDVDWENDFFEIHFVSLGRATDCIRKRERQGQQSIAGLEDIEDRSSVFFYDESDLNMRLRDAQAFEDLISEPVDVRLSHFEDEQPWMCYQNSDGRRCYVGRMNGAQVCELYKRYRSRLFALNIRDYLGELATNRRIIGTAIESPQDFFFYNNGLSAVSKDVEEDSEGGLLHCEGFSIINGAQTATSIFKAQSRQPAADLSELEVMIRISVLRGKKDREDGEFLDCVTQYNNTQNAIKLPDFRSNDPVQKALRHQFSKLNFRGKRFCYLNKRAKVSTSGQIPIRMEELAKTVHAFEFGPADYHGGSKYLFDVNTGQGYSKVFGDGVRVWEHVDTKDFTRIAGTWFLCSVVLGKLKECKERILRKEKEQIEDGIVDEGVAGKALERRHLVFFVLGELLRAKCQGEGEDCADVLARLSKPQWMEEDEARCSSVGDYTECACEILVRRYRNDSRPASFTHRNWFRSSDTLRQIKSDVRTGLTTLKALPML